MHLHIIPRKVAVALGMKRYLYTTCKAGHFSERLVSNNSCLACQRDRDAARRAADPEATRAKWRAQHAKNKERRNQQSREYRANNPDKWRIINAESKKKRACGISEYMADYRGRNADRINQQNAEYRAANRELMNARTRKWRKENPETYLASKAARRAAELRAMPEWADHAAIRAIYKEAARISEETGIPHHVDHDIPLCGKTVCGLHVRTNLRIIPAVDNMRKSNRFECS